MRFGTITLILVAAFVVTTGALAAGALKEPKSLALRESDFPATAERWGGKAITAAQLDELYKGARGQTYVTTFQFPSGQKREIVMDILVAGASAGQARTTFAALKRHHLSDPIRRVAVRLPAYGDEQLAAVIGDVRNEEAASWLVVRKNTVVWALEIGTDPSAKDFGLSKAQALSELEKYAAKQKLRVGAG